jgi:hypothetical protein
MKIHMVNRNFSQTGRRISQEDTLKTKARSGRRRRGIGRSGQVFKIGSWRSEREKGRRKVSPKTNQPETNKEYKVLLSSTILIFI